MSGSGSTTENVGTAMGATSGTSTPSNSNTPSNSSPGFFSEMGSFFSDITSGSFWFDVAFFLIGLVMVLGAVMSSSPVAGTITQLNNHTGAALKGVGAAADVAAA